MGAVTTSVVVNFENPSDAEGVLKAEVDTRPCGLNGGKSTFRPGDTVYIVLWKSSNVEDFGYTASAGSLSATSSSVTYNITDVLTFIDSDTASINYPVSSGFSSTWVGNNLGAVTPSDSEVTLNSAPETAHYVGVLKVSYASVGQVYKLVAPDNVNGDTKFSITVVFWGRIPEDEDECS